jgi:glycosyltransferase involved in cell wall biosynthesis
MKILMTSSGGVIRDMEGWYEHGLAKELVGRGHEVTVFSSNAASKYHRVKAEEVINGIRAKRFNPVLPGSFFRMVGGKWDIIHMHHFGYLAPISSYAAVAEKIKRTPSVFNVTGIFHDPYLVGDVDDPFAGKINFNVQKNFPLLRPWKIKNWFVHAPLFTADRILGMTNWEKKNIEKLGIEKGKIDVAPIGIELKKYRKTKRDFFKERNLRGEILLFVGQPTKRKGWEYLIRAMPMVLKRFPEAKAVFIGYRNNDEMNFLIRSLHIENSVVMMGYLSDNDKISAFQSADAFVFPTLYEGFGMVYLESMAAGLPIVTTDVAGVSEIVEHGSNGLLTKPKDSAGLAKAIIKILEDRKLRAAVKRNNLAKVKKYDWSTVADRYLEIYEKAVNSFRN